MHHDSVFKVTSTEPRPLEYRPLDPGPWTPGPWSKAPGQNYIDYRELVREEGRLFLYVEHNHDMHDSVIYI